MPLTDAYCLFNRARGIELISPSEFREACESHLAVGLGMTLRRFPSGVIAIQTAEHDVDAVIAQLTALLDRRGSLSAFDVVEGLDGQERGLTRLPLELASEYLELAERRGVLCRDDTIAGTRFHRNLFVQFESPIQ